MQSAIIVAHQVIIMFLLTMVGVFCSKKGLLTESVARYLSTFLLNIALPSVMLSSLYRPMQYELLAGFGLTFLLAVLLHLLAILASRLLICTRDGQACRTERFGVIYANAAYMAIPLIRATLGEESTFFATAFVSVFLLFHWTQGVLELGGSVNPKKLLYNPCILSVILGLLIFGFQIPIPGPVIDTVRLLGGLTTPLSMIITGVFLADLKLDDLKSLRMYWAALLRTIIVPLAGIAIVVALGASDWFVGAEIACLAAVYCFSCPTAVSVILLSASLGKDVLYPSSLVAVTTMISLVALPVIAVVANTLLV
ncbi:AEC family transporter [Oscillospiraceae bacterium LTW-04]|nr:AEC family transporter [Oscillospiraceae bacterium MB24-C1]